MKAIIKAIIAGSVIIGIGLILFIAGLGLNGWKFMPEFEMEQYIAEGEVTELRIDNAVGNVKTEFYDGDKVTVDYPVSDRYVMRIEKSAGVLMLNGLNKRHWYNFSFLPSTLPETVVKIPQGAVLKLDVKVNAGSVKLAEGRYKETSVKMNAGSIHANGISCPAFKCEVNAGAISIKSLESESFDCKLNAGSFNAEQVVCPQIRLKVNAGSAGLKVRGTKEEYTISVDKSAGSCNLTSQTGTDEKKKIDIDLSAGSVNVSFTS